MGSLRSYIIRVTTECFIFITYLHLWSKSPNTHRHTQHILWKAQDHTHRPANNARFMPIIIYTFKVKCCGRKNYKPFTRPTILHPLKRCITTHLLPRFKNRLGKTNTKSLRRTKCRINVNWCCRRTFG